MNPSNTKPNDIDIAARLSQVLANCDPCDTRALVQSTALTLFHEFGEIPSANRVRDLIGRGSLSTVVDELRVFWTALRESIRTTSASPGIPDAFVAAHANALPALWRAALSAASAQVRSESKPYQDALIDTLNKTQEQRDNMRQRAQQVEQALLQANALCLSMAAANKSLEDQISLLSASAEPL